jgi:Zn finger protein HypA/HybF involved in hydrogenase expression
MSEKRTVTVRYQCDQCYTLVSSIDDLKEYHIRQILGSMVGEGELHFETRRELWCKDCTGRNDKVISGG